MFSLHHSWNCLGFDRFQQQLPGKFSDQTAKDVSLAVTDENWCAAVNECFCPAFCCVFWYFKSLFCSVFLRFCLCFASVSSVMCQNKIEPNWSKGEQAQGYKTWARRLGVVADVLFSQQFLHSSRQNWSRPQHSTGHRNEMSTDRRARKRMFLF